MLHLCIETGARKAWCGVITLSLFTNLICIDLGAGEDLLQDDYAEREKAETL